MIDLFLIFATVVFPRKLDFSAEKSSVLGPSPAGIPRKHNRRSASVTTLLLALIIASMSGAFPMVVLAATGAPRVMNYQGRLMQPDGTLLGGSGTDYCFKFSFYDDSVVGGGDNKLWPTGTPSTMTVVVKSGVFNVGIGDTAVGGDTLDYNFEDSDTVYLNVEVADKVGATCAAGDGAESYETLSPRQRIFSSGYAINSNTVGGRTAAQLIAAGFSTTSADHYAHSSSTLVKTYANNTFTGTNIFTGTASTSNLVVSNGFTFGTISGILKSTLGVIAAALVDLTTDVTGILGIANGGTGTSTTPTFGKLLVGNALGGYDLIATSSLGINAGVWGNITGTLSAQTDLQSALDEKLALSSWYATTTDGLAEGSTNKYFSNALVNSFIHASTTIPKMYTANAFTALQTFSSGVSASSLAITGAGTTTAQNGIDITEGCFSVNGSCVSGGGGGSGTLVNIQTFTADGTYTPTVGAAIAYVVVTGGGGGGGGAQATDGTSETAAGGGGAGGTTIEVVDLTAVSSVSVTVGAGGGGGANTGGNGSAGGPSYFGTFAGAYGGSLGTGASTGGICDVLGTAGTGGAASSTGKVNLGGGDGESPSCLAELVRGGSGGASHWGDGGVGGAVNAAGGAVAGSTGTGYGSGGGAAAASDASGGALGGDGAGGVVIVYEYGPFTGVMRASNGGTGTSTPASWGNVLMWTGSNWEGTATSSLGIVGGGGGAWAWTTLTNWATTTNATTTAYTAPAYFASSTLASQFPYASSTAFSTATLCLSGDCRSAWPVGGAGSWSWATDTAFGTSTNATTTPTWYKTGLIASSTSQLASANIWNSISLKATSSALLSTDVNGMVIATTTIGVNYLSGTLTASQGGTGTSTPASYGNILAWNGTNWAGLATSTLAISTTNLIEGSNLFFTNARVQTYLDTLSKGFFFSTTSTDYWKTQNNFFATTSADHWLTQQTTDDLAQGATSKYYSSLLFAGDLAGTTTDALAEGSTNKYFSNALVGAYISGSSTIPHIGGSAFGDMLSWTGSAWATRATSTLGVAISDTVGILGESRGGTNQTTYVKGDILYASDDNVLARLPIGANGEVLKVTGAGIPQWGMDLTSGGGGGGSGYFSTTTNSLAIFPSVPSYVVMVGNTSTSTDDSIFEVSGRSYFSNRIGIATTSPGSIFSVNDVANFDANGSTFYSSITAPAFTATNATTTNATSTNLSVTGTASTSNLIASNGFTFKNVTGFLKATAGAVATALVDLTSDVTGILGIANGGTGTSTVPTYGKLLVGNSVGGYDLVATSSLGITAGGASAWGSITGTLSAQTDLQSVLDEKLALSSWYATTTDGLAEGSTNKYFSNALVGAYISSSSTIPHVGGTAFGDMLSWTGSAWATLATSTLSLKTVDLVEESNLFWTNTRFDNRLSATTTLPSLTTLANLATVGTITSGTFSSVISGATINSTAIGATNASTAVFTNATTTNATSTNLAVTSISSGLVAANGSGSLIAASIGSSLSFSGNSLSLNLSNPNLWTGLQTFGNASTTAASALDYVTVGRIATTTIRGEANATSTFAGGVQAAGLSITGSATSTFNNGLSITGGCISVNGACLTTGGGGNFYITKLAAIYATSSAGTTTVQFIGANNSNPSWSAGTLTIQNNVAYYTVEVWGGGGGGGAQATNAGATGADSCYSQGSVACALPLVWASGGGGGAAAAGTPGSGGTGLVGSVLATGGSGARGGNGSNQSDRTGFGGDGAHGGGAGGASSGTGTAGEDGQAPGGGGGGGWTTTAGGSGGGGGGYAMDVASTSVKTSGKFVVGAGGAGGAAGTQPGGAGGSGGVVIVVYATSTPGSTGYDYAEMYPVSNPAIGAGDIVAVDVGVPVSMKLARAGEKAPLAGIISTAPGQVLGDQNDTSMRPIAFSGRVPAKVNLEGGPIKIGDRIAISSVRGVGKKAEQFEDSVGIAIDTYDGTQSEATVMVFIDLQKGTNMNAVSVGLLNNDMTLFGLVASTTLDAISGPLDFVGAMMNAIAARMGSFASATASEATSTSSTTSATSSESALSGIALYNIMKNLSASSGTSSQLAALSIALSRATIDTLEVDAIKPIERDVQIRIGEDGKFIIAKAGEEDMSVTFEDTSTTKPTIAVSIDALGNALFAGALTAANFEVGSAEHPGGITMYDTATGAPYCTQIAGGKLKTVVGKCGEGSATLTSADDGDVSGGGVSTIERSSPPIIIIQGNNPAYIDIGATYADLGARVTDDHDNNLGIHTYVNGAEVQVVSIDTSVPGTHTIHYRVTDTDGNISQEHRVVVVGDEAGASEPPAPAAEPESTPASETTTEASPSTESVDATPEPTPTPAPTEESTPTAPTITEPAPEPTPTTPAPAPAETPTPDNNNVTTE